MSLDRMKRMVMVPQSSAVEAVPRLQAALGLGPQLYFKRDDQLGPAGGGNKIRKLEYLLAEGIQAGADTLITTGGVQSNHARMTAAVARKLGLEVHLVLTSATLPQRLEGNLLLDFLMGAHLSFVETNAMEAMQALATQLRAQDKTPYIIPAGGSTPTGALGYVRCLHEILAWSCEHQVHFDCIVAPAGSAGTLAGLAAGAAYLNYPTTVLGISVAKEAGALREQTEALADATLQLLECSPLSSHHQVQLQINDEHVGPGYGVVTEGCLAAIALVAQTEGIILDPVYTGKAMDALMSRWLDMTEYNYVLFVHTGGLPGLLAGHGYWSPPWLSQ